MLLLGRLIRSLIRWSIRLYSIHYNINYQRQQQFGNIVLKNKSIQHFFFAKIKIIVRWFDLHPQAPTKTYKTTIRPKIHVNYGFRWHTPYKKCWHPLILLFLRAKMCVWNSNTKHEKRFELRIKWDLDANQKIDVAGNQGRRGGDDNKLKMHIIINSPFTF